MRNALAGEVRKQYIFHSDGECATTTRKASDGFEHGYLSPREVFRLSVSSLRAGAASNVRRAIFELLVLPESAVDALCSPPYDKPLPGLPRTRFVAATLHGDADKPAPPDSPYPYVTCEVVDTKLSPDKSGRITVTETPELTFHIGEEVAASVQRVDVLRPDQDHGVPTAD